MSARRSEAGRRERKFQKLKRRRENEQRAPATIASGRLCIMDASGAVYPLFPNHVSPLAETPAGDATTNARQCSVRGCTLLVPGDLAHKMCDTCRSRHRIYASKKRAKRNLEKASAISTPVTASESETPLGTAESSPVPQECEWVVTTGQNYQVSPSPPSFVVLHAAGNALYGPALFSIFVCWWCTTPNHGFAAHTPISIIFLELYHIQFRPMA